MKKMRKLRFLFAVAIVLSLAVASSSAMLACKKGGSGSKVPPLGASVRLNKTTLDLSVYDTFTLTATTENTDAAVVWSSSDSTVASVDGGLVSALKVGSATITASAGGASATCDVTVTKSTDVPVFKMDTNIKVASGDTYTFDLAVTWKGEILTEPIEYTWTPLTTDADEIVQFTTSNGGASVSVKGLKYGNAQYMVSATVRDTLIVETLDIAVRNTDIRFELDLPKSNNGYTASLSLKDVDEKESLSGVALYKSVAMGLRVFDKNVEVTDDASISYTYYDNVDLKDIMGASGSTGSLIVKIEGGEITATSLGKTVIVGAYEGNDFLITVDTYRPEILVQVPGKDGYITVETGVGNTFDVPITIDDGEGIEEVVINGKNVLDGNVTTSGDTIGVKFDSKKMPIASKDMGEGYVYLNSAIASYTVPALVVTKVINNSSDLDNMYALMVKEDANPTIPSVNSSRGITYDGYFVLGGDITYSGNFIPVGYDGGEVDESAGGDSFDRHVFIGTFDGRGYNIDNFKVTGDGKLNGLNAYYVAMFAGLGDSGVVRNVSFTNPTFNKYLIAVNCYGTIENVYVGGTATVSGSANSTIFGYDYVGKNFKVKNVLIDLSDSSGITNPNFSVFGRLAGGGGGSGKEAAKKLPDAGVAGMFDGYYVISNGLNLVPSFVDTKSITYTNGNENWYGNFASASALKSDATVTAKYGSDFASWIGDKSGFWTLGLSGVPYPKNLPADGIVIEMETKITVATGETKTVNVAAKWKGETVTDPITYNWEPITDNAGSIVEFTPSNNGASVSVKGLNYGNATYKVSATVRGTLIEEYLEISVRNESISFELNLPKSDNGYEVSLPLKNVDEEKSLDGKTHSRSIAMGLRVFDNGVEVQGASISYTYYDDGMKDGSSFSTVVNVSDGNITALTLGTTVIVGAYSGNEFSITVKTYRPEIRVDIDDGPVLIEACAESRAFNVPNAIPDGETIKEVVINGKDVLAGGVTTTDGKIGVTFDPKKMPTASKDMGEGCYVYLNSDVASYAVPAFIVTKVIKTSKDLDDMYKYMTLTETDKTLPSVGNTKGTTYDGYFILGNDITYSGNFVPIGYGGGEKKVTGDAYHSHVFIGTFDGMGHNIDKFTVKRTRDTGDTIITGSAYYFAMFVALGDSGVVRNVSFTNPTFDNTLIARFCYGTIENVYVGGNVNIANNSYNSTIFGYDYVGKNFKVKNVLIDLSGITAGDDLSKFSVFGRLAGSAGGTGKDAVAKLPDEGVEGMFDGYYVISSLTKLTPDAMIEPTTYNNGNGNRYGNFASAAALASDVADKFASWIDDESEFWTLDLSDVPYPKNLPMDGLVVEMETKITVAHGETEEFDVTVTWKGETVTDPITYTWTPIMDNADSIVEFTTSNGGASVSVTAKDFGDVRYKLSVTVKGVTVEKYLDIAVPMENVRFELSLTPSDGEYGYEVLLPLKDVDEASKSVNMGLKVYNADQEVPDARISYTYYDNGTKDGGTGSLIVEIVDGKIIAKKLGKTVIVGAYKGKEFSISVETYRPEISVQVPNKDGYIIVETSGNTFDVPITIDGDEEIKEVVINDENVLSGNVSSDQGKISVTFDPKKMPTASKDMGEGFVYVQSDLATYTVPALIVTKVINNSQDLDDMYKYMIKKQKDHTIESIVDNAGVQKSDGGITYDGYFVLGKDITYTGTNFVPIGYDGGNEDTAKGGDSYSRHVFIGTFDGRGYDIKDFTVKKEKNSISGSVLYFAMFAVLGDSGVVRNVSFTNPTFDNSLIARNCYGTVENVYVGGTINIPNSTAASAILGTNYVGKTFKAKNVLIDLSGIEGSTGNFSALGRLNGDGTVIRMPDAGVAGMFDGYYAINSTIKMSNYPEPTTYSNGNGNWYGNFSSADALKNDATVTAKYGSDFVAWTENDFWILAPSGVPYPANLAKT